MKIDGMGSRILADKLKGAAQTIRNTQTEFPGAFSSSLLEQQEETEQEIEISGKLDLEATRTSTAMAVLNSVRISVTSWMECEVRKLTYEQSDNVKVLLEEGYTLKAKVDVTAHKVYVEAKGEDGTVKGYEVDPLAIDKNTKDAMEQMALESWEMARRSCMGDGFFTPVGKTGGYEAMALEKALTSFYDFIRQKLGAPEQILQQELLAMAQDQGLESMDLVKNRDISMRTPTQEQIRKILEDN